MEMVIILVVALIVLGPRRLPQMLKTLGRVMAEMRRTADEVRDELMFDEDIREIRQTVREMQDISTATVEQLMREGEEELEGEEFEEDGRGKGTQGGGELEEAGRAEEEKEESERG